MTIGFIGCGNMGGAILKGILKSGKVSNKEILVSASNQERTTKRAEEYGVQPSSNNEIANTCDIVFLAVKPYYTEAVLTEVKDDWRKSGQIVVSVVTGWNLKRLYTLIPEEVTVVNTMPNTPCNVGAGVFAINAEAEMTESERETVVSLIEGLGEVVYIHENQIEALSGVCGCGPAYYYMMIEAMADGGVAMGLPRNLALQLAAQAAVGAGKMVLETQQHPGALKDAVCSPKGSTILGVHELEKGAFRGTVMNAVITATKKMLDMANE